MTTACIGDTEHPQSGPPDRPEENRRQSTRKDLKKDSSPSAFQLVTNLVVRHSLISLGGKIANRTKPT